MSGQPAVDFVRKARRFAPAKPVLDHHIRDADPGTPIPFVLLTPGKKRDNIDPSHYPWILENYEKNPVVLPFHNALTFPIGRGVVERSQMAGRTGLLTELEFDVEDPVGNLADSKYRRGFMHAVSAGWEDVDKNGIPVRFSRKRMAANDLVEYSIVSIPGDPDALKDPSVSVQRRVRGYFRDMERDEITQQFDFLEEAFDALRTSSEYDARGDYQQRAQSLEHLLRGLKLCDGDECRNAAIHIIGNGRSAGAGQEGDNRDDVAAQETTIEQSGLETESHVEGDAGDGEVPDDAQAEGETDAGGVPDDTEAEGATERRRQVAMASMYRAVWVDDPDEADDDERKALYDSLEPEYRRLKLTRPAFMKAHLVASLTDSQKRLLLPNGEVELMNGKGPNTRIGKTHSGATISKLESIDSEMETIESAAVNVRSTISDMVADSNSRNKRGGCGCGCSGDCGGSHSRGAELSAFLNERIDEYVTDELSAEDIVAGMVEATGLDAETIDGFVAGGDACPTADQIELLAGFLEVDTQLVTDAAIADGCSYGDADDEDEDAAVARALQALADKYPTRQFAMVAGGPDEAEREAANRRAILDLSMTEYVEDYADEMHLSGSLDLTGDQLATLSEALAASAAEPAENGTRVSLMRWTPWDDEEGPQAGDTEAWISLTLQLPAELVEEFSLAVVQGALKDPDGEPEPGDGGEPAEGADNTESLDDDDTDDDEPAEMPATLAEFFARNDETNSEVTA